MVATRCTVMMALVGLVLAVTSSTALAQGTVQTGKSCTFHPKDGSAPVSVANGETYSPAIQGSQQKHLIGGKWKCEDGKLTKVPE
ncbi:MAG TPA: hypothetical protein VLX09_00035 [Stellaceae bacterium]|nr:hypothetical protein [Stellaceae bacterium]